MVIKNAAGINTSKVHYMPAPRKPAVTLQPQTYFDIREGTNRIIAAIRPTLGPLPRLVLSERSLRTEAPEFLDDGALIARRIIQIKPRGQDVGAMLARHALWRMHEEIGDGATTMGVVYQFIVNEGIRYITEFGCNAMLLRKGLEKGLMALLSDLPLTAKPLLGKDAITHVASGMTQGDSEMADLLGEIMDIVGPEGLIVVEKWNKRGLEREYIEGTYWHLSGWFSRLLVKDPIEKRTMFDDASLLISDMVIHEPEMLLPVLERCSHAGIKHLVIIASDINDRAIGILVKNNQAKTIETLAVRTPRTQEMARVDAMEDIAALTGGIPFYKAAHATFDDFSVEYLGHCRRAWATHSLFGIFGGKGDLRQIKQRIQKLRNQLKQAELDSDKELLQQRLGRLVGGTAILRIGGISESELDTRKEIANRAVTGLRLAIQGGVIPGGGSALVSLQSTFQKLSPENEDEAIAFRILNRALEEPMRTIVSNAGFQPDVVLYQVKQSPPKMGFDAIKGSLVNMEDAGIMDAALVVSKALQIGISSAALALTTDVIVHHKQPKEVVEP